MAFAIRSSRRVRIAKPRNASSQHRRIVFRIVTGGVVAAAAVVMTVTAAMLAAGWLLTAATRDRSDMRLVIAQAAPSELPIWTVRAAGDMVRPDLARPMMVAVQSRPVVERSFDMPKLNPLGALALVVPDSMDMAEEIFAEPVITGSIGKTSFKLAALDVGSGGGRPERPPQTDDGQVFDGQVSNAHALPLPRPRPRLAALGPVQDLGIKVEEDARSLRTAIYDITAQIVYLPSGERLEAHSGLGEFMDDPRHVNKKNRGATPPNTYALTLRESLFHGVQAIRLTPVSEANMFDRDGILAHTYMLGPSGQSNGCVSFRDYPKFLRAYQRGEIDRIVVVPRLASPPASFARGNARSANAL
jgi:hypothetical protein